MGGKSEATHQKLKNRQAKKIGKVSILHPSTLYYETNPYDIVDNDIESAAHESLEQIVTIFDRPIPNGSHAKTNLHTWFNFKQLFRLFPSSISDEGDIEATRKL
jgi:hypothetical protein